MSKPKIKLEGLTVKHLEKLIKQARQEEARKRFVLSVARVKQVLQNKCFSVVHKPIRSEKELLLLSFGDLTIRDSNECDMRIPFTAVTVSHSLYRFDKLNSKNFIQGEFKSNVNSIHEAPYIIPEYFSFYTIVDLFTTKSKYQVSSGIFNKLYNYINSYIGIPTIQPRIATIVNTAAARCGLAIANNIYIVFFNAFKELQCKSLRLKFRAKRRICNTVWMTFPLPIGKPCTV